MKAQSEASKLPWDDRERARRARPRRRCRSSGALADLAGKTTKKPEALSNKGVRLSQRLFPNCLSWGHRNAPVFQLLSAKLALSLR
eukprot:scaffold495_cov243-Pinguiococcus_pyrenoidosus.AAC.25